MAFSHEPPDKIPTPTYRVRLGGQESAGHLLESGTQYSMSAHATPELEQKFRILRSVNQLQADFVEAVAALRDADTKIGVIFLDIDHFKSLNTKHTETKIDQTILPQLQNLLGKMVKLRGHAYRQGGEEFVVLLPNHAANETHAFAERMREAIAQHRFTVDGAKERITVSVGVACWPDNGDTLDQVKQAANDAEHEAKAAGRNRVRVAKGAAVTGDVIAVARAVKAANDFQEARRVWLHSYSAVEEAEREVKAIIAAMHQQSLEVAQAAGLDVLSGGNDLQWTLTDQKVSLVLRWQSFSNTLHEAGLQCTEYDAQMIAPPGYQVLHLEAPSVLGTFKYEPDVDRTMKFHWRDPSHPEQHYNSAEIARTCMLRFLELVKRGQERRQRR